MSSSLFEMSCFHCKDTGKVDKNIPTTNLCSYCYGKKTICIFKHPYYFTGYKKYK